MTNALVEVLVSPRRRRMGLPADGSMPILSRPAAGIHARAASGSAAVAAPHTLTARTDRTGVAGRLGASTTTRSSTEVDITEDLWRFTRISRRATAR